MNTRHMVVAVAAMVAFCGEAAVRRIELPEGVISNKVTRSEAIGPETKAFSIAFRINPEVYVKRPGPVEGMVFSNGTGYYDGCRATLMPAAGGFRISLRVVHEQGESRAEHVSSRVGLPSGCWNAVVFSWDGTELSCFVNGVLTEKRAFAGPMKKPCSGFAVGPSGYGVGFYPFAAKDFTIRDGTMTEREALAFATGGATGTADVAAYLAALDPRQFTVCRALAWMTAAELKKKGNLRAAGELYRLLAEREPAARSVDGGNAVAAEFAAECGVAGVKGAVAGTGTVPFRGYDRPWGGRTKIDSDKAVHVSPKGDDAAGDGTAAKPFATLAKALAAVRGRAVRQIAVHGGRYRVTASTELGADDSGTPEAPLVIAAADGEKPVFDCATEVGGFVPYGTEGTLVADVSALWNGRSSLGGGYEELIEDNAACTLARHPNEGFFEITSVDTNRLTFKADVPDLASWAKEPELKALTYMRWFWRDETTRLRIDAARGEMQVDTNRVKVVKAKHPIAFLNALKALDAPGEWFLDHGAKKLYVRPRKPGARYSLTGLDAPVIAVKKARNVEIAGLGFVGGRRSAISVQGGRDIRVTGCAIRNFESAVSVSGRDVEISNCRMATFGQGAITAHGGNRKTLTPSGIRILGNDVSDIERRVRTYCPCVQAEGVGIEIAWNHFHDCPSSAMRIEGNDVLICSNLVERCVTESDDQGAVDIYANPTYAGIRIVGNTWRDIGGNPRFTPCGQAAVRFDDIISGVEVRGNLFERCGLGHFGAVQINGGRLNLIDGNRFVDCRKDVSIGGRTEKWWKHTMTEGYAAPKIREMPIDGEIWRARYPYMANILDWPPVNFVSRNVYVGVKDTSRRDGENGNRVEASTKDN